MKNNDHVTADTTNVSSSSSSLPPDPQGPVPALSSPNGGRSPTRPSTSAVSGAERGGGPLGRPLLIGHRRPLSRGASRCQRTTRNAAPRALGGS
jgi:hypothetical protein